MMDFISIPLTFGIVTYGIYSLFELFVHKKERLMFRIDLGIYYREQNGEKE